jgi:hypothetical protein
MSAFKPFDVDAELEILRSPPANPANRANPPPDISNISDTSRPLPEESQAFAPGMGLLPEAVGGVWVCPACGQIVALAEVDKAGRKHFVCPAGDRFTVIPKEPGKPSALPVGELFTPGKRAFLPRPLGQEDSPDPWEVWQPLFAWLIEHAPERFHAICEAEGAIRTLERSGITGGPRYEQACAELLWRFEEARRLMRSKFVKIVLQ